MKLSLEHENKSGGGNPQNKARVLNIVGTRHEWS